MADLSSCDKDPLDPKVSNVYNLAFYRSLPTLYMHWWVAASIMQDILIMEALLVTMVLNCIMQAEFSGLYINFLSYLMSCNKFLSAENRLVSLV